MKNDFAMRVSKSLWPNALNWQDIMHRDNRWKWTCL